MTGIGSFFGHYGAEKVHEAGEGLVGAIVSRDPTAAIRVDIADRMRETETAAHHVAEKTTALVAAQNAAKPLEDRKNHLHDAAVAIRDKIAASTDDAEKDHLKAQAAAIIPELKAVAGDDMTGNTSGPLYNARQVVKAAQEDFNGWRETHQHAIDRLTAAQGNLTTAINEMQTARNNAELAAARKHDAEERAKIDTGHLDPGNIALSAIHRQTAHAQEQADADNIQAAALRHVADAAHPGPSEADKIADEVLGTGKKPSSVDSDLANL